MGRNSWKIFQPSNQQAIAFVGYVDPQSNHDLDHLLSRTLDFRPGETARVLLRLTMRDGGHRLIRITFKLLSEHMPHDLADLNPTDAAKFEVFKGHASSDKEAGERAAFWRDLDGGQREYLTLGQLAWLANFTSEEVAELLAQPGAPPIYNPVSGQGGHYVLGRELLQWMTGTEATAHMTNSTDRMSRVLRHRTGMNADRCTGQT